MSEEEKMEVAHTQAKGEEESDGEESDSDEEEEEEEPKLKYQRLGAHATGILQRDSASCLGVHEKFLALGTRSGMVYILDFNGNENKRITCHAGPVNEVSIDATGEYIASCSNDGKVVVTNLVANEMNKFEYQKRPVLSCALDPEYSRRDTRRFTCGGRTGQLVLNTKGFMGFGAKNVVLHSGEGPIYAVKWRSNFIAWANDLGVKIFDCRSNQRITYIDRPQGSPRPDMYKCHLCWSSDTRLIIGWADCVKIGIIKTRPSALQGQPSHYVEIVAEMSHLDYWISGIAPFGNDGIVILSYVDEEDDSDEEDGAAQKNLTNGRLPPTSPSAQPTNALRPELRIVYPDNVSDDMEVSSDALTIHGYQTCGPTDYHLQHVPHEALYYIVAPNDIVVAKPRDLDDHLSWLLERERYGEALEAAERNEALMRTHNLVDIGEMYLGHLVRSGDIETAASLCPKILRRDAARWDAWIFKFARNGSSDLKAISPYIPTGDPTLSARVYELVLNDFLINDHDGFLKTIRAWPSNLYNIQNIINVVLERLKHAPNTDTLMDALAELYTYDKQFDNTIHIHLRRKKGNVFELIQEHKLYDAVQNKVLPLVLFDEVKGISMLIENHDKIPIAHVVSQLSAHPRLQHAYLDALFKKDQHIGRDFHELQVKLYAEYEPQKLLMFLNHSNHYNLEHAMSICEAKHLHKETVFILSRMGNTRQALEMLIDKIGNVQEAIEFVQTQQDAELWDYLIEKSINNPEFVSGLLENIGAHVDPILLIKRIPFGMEISGLRDRLVKIISDYNLQMSLREGCNTILKADCVDLIERLYTGQRHACRIDETTAKCAVCEGNTMAGMASSSVVGFFCGHIYHQRCLRSTLFGASAAAAADHASPIVGQAAADGSAAAPGADLNTSMRADDSAELFCCICQSVQNNKGRGARGGGGAAAAVDVR
eukprot:TRINITY_DN896_c0_g1_i3.p1 TRINITY_DN896_c0_g1~~TRINITY_DN896_c0_g1_i3.p1  ORF type:complete len:938 (+),score=181.35 TRINITY_DN896_c0_g1_i3:205-3018(+)